MSTNLLQLTIAFALVVSTPAFADAGEYAVKAALLYNFSKFIDWPESAFAGSPDFGICLLGGDPYGVRIDAVARKRTHGRSIRIARLENVSKPASPCHIAFITKSVVGSLQQTLTDLDNEPVLTVGEGPEFIEDGGMIGLVREGSRIRFEINRGATRRAGLSVSAQLLRIAERVIGR